MSSSSDGLFFRRFKANAPGSTSHSEVRCRATGPPCTCQRHTSQGHGSQMGSATRATPRTAHCHRRVSHTRTQAWPARFSAVSTAVTTPVSLSTTHVFRRPLRATRQNTAQRGNGARKRQSGANRRSFAPRAPQQLVLYCCGCAGALMHEGPPPLSVRLLCAFFPRLPHF